MYECMHVYIHLYIYDYISPIFVFFPFSITFFPTCFSGGNTACISYYNNNY